MILPCYRQMVMVVENDESRYQNCFGAGQRGKRDHTSAYPIIRMPLNLFTISHCLRIRVCQTTTLHIPSRLVLPPRTLLYKKLMSAAQDASSLLDQLLLRPGQMLKDGRYEVHRKLGGGLFSNTWLVSDSQAEYV